MAYMSQAGTPINLSSSGIISKVAGSLLGYHVNSTSSGTIVFRDGTLAASAVISGTITPAIGFQWFPAAMPNGAFATIGGTLDVTFFFAAG
jgi:hypothetical protein